MSASDRTQRGLAVPPPAPRLTPGGPGPLWDTLPPLQRQRLVKCLSRMIQSRLRPAPPAPSRKKPSDDLA